MLDTPSVRHRHWEKSSHAANLHSSALMRTHGIHAFTALSCHLSSVLVCPCCAASPTNGVLVLYMQKQPLLHQQSKGKGKAGAPPTNGHSGSAADHSEAGNSSDPEESSKDRGEHWPAVEAAEANEPVGIITIEDVLEELIGQVSLPRGAHNIIVDIVKFALSELFNMHASWGSGLR